MTKWIWEDKETDRVMNREKEKCRGGKGTT